MRGGLLGEWLHMQPMTAEQADLCLIWCLVSLTAGWFVHWLRTMWDGPRPDCRRCEWPSRCRTAEEMSNQMREALLTMCQGCAHVQPNDKEN